MAVNWRYRCTSKRAPATTPSGIASSRASPKPLLTLRASGRLKAQRGTLVGCNADIGTSPNSSAHIAAVPLYLGGQNAAVEKGTEFPFDEVRNQDSACLVAPRIPISWGFHSQWPYYRLLLIWPDTELMLPSNQGGSIYCGRQGRSHRI